jgi:hypothetical protein
MIQRTLFFAFLNVFCLATTFVFGQNPVVIKLDNPSFEDYPRIGSPPKGWLDCGFEGETPPDTNPTGMFDVSKKAYHGETYLGMVTRDNNTWESVEQKLESPLLSDVTYTFSLYLAQSKTYNSQSRLTLKDVNYNTPTIVRVWAGTDRCTKKELLAQSPPIGSSNWEKFDFTFTPKSNYDYFLIEVFYKDQTTSPYNGNILVDNASNIVPEKK